MCTSNNSSHLLEAYMHPCRIKEAMLTQHQQLKTCARRKKKGERIHPHTSTRGKMPFNTKSKMPSTHKASFSREAPCCTWNISNRNWAGRCSFCGGIFSHPPQWITLDIPHTGRTAAASGTVTTRGLHNNTRHIPQGQDKGKSSDTRLSKRVRRKSRQRPSTTKHGTATP